MQNSELPQHIALIPDGNRRWAKANGKSVIEAHKAGYETLKQVADYAVARGITTLTVYAFSTENWKRAREEVGALIKLLEWGLKHEVKGYHARGIKLRFWGSRSDLDSGLVKAIEAAEELTVKNRTATFNICFNYGGRSDLVQAIQKLTDEGEEITEQSIAAHLSSTGTLDPDLIVRTSGEKRLSNFLPWESAYSELCFTDVMWPEFNEAELDKALADYALRKRRFGA